MIFGYCGQVETLVLFWHSLQHVARFGMPVNVTFVEWSLRISGYELARGQAERAMDLELQNNSDKVAGEERKGKRIETAIIIVVVII